MTRRGESGFSLVVLMAGITITLILMSAAVPSWQYVMQDDKEQEMLFRGAQIADSIGRYQKKNGGALPVSLEVLVKGKFLRKAYKDPMMRDGKWRFIRQGEALAPVRTAPGTGTGPTTTTTTTTTMPQSPKKYFGPSRPRFKVKSKMLYACKEDRQCPALSAGPRSKTIPQPTGTGFARPFRRLAATACF